MKNVLGVKVGHHDPGAAIVTKNGEVYAISEERLNRIKHSTGMFPKLAIDYVINAASLTYKDIDVIAVDRVVDADVKKIFKDSAPVGLVEKEIVLVNHHDAHAASSVYCSGFSDALVVVIDGAGEAFQKRERIYSVESMSVYEFTEGKLHLLDKVVHDRNMDTYEYLFSTGIGKIYTNITRYMGFSVYQEGKTMGLAPFGGKQKRFQEELKKNNWYKVVDGKIYCNPNIIYPNSSSIEHKIKNLLKLQYIKRKIKNNKKYANEFVFSDPIVLERPMRGKTISLPDDYYTEVAYFVQKTLEEAIIESVQYYKNKTGQDNICTAGGVALNIDANSRLYTDLKFKKIFTQPASNDSGIPLGNALYAYYIEGQYTKRPYIMNQAYLGRKYSDLEIKDALESSDLEYKYEEDVCAAAAELLAENKILGWFQGASEYGPRALGNRSILMSPLGKDNKDIINFQVKKREGFRPFAPITLIEKAHEYFIIPADESRFMLLVAHINEKYRDRIPAVTHIDNSARVQTLEMTDNPVTYNLIKKFGEITGISVLLNTSFNVAGEPIVETPADAIKCYKKSGLDYLVLGNYICCAEQ